MSTQVENKFQWPEHLQPHVLPDTGRLNLLGLSLQNMQDALVALGEKPFRATQSLKWIPASIIS